MRGLWIWVMVSISRPSRSTAPFTWREGTKLLRPEQYYTEVAAELFMKDAKKALELARKILDIYLMAVK